MKFDELEGIVVDYEVTPLAGVWIEITGRERPTAAVAGVTPLAGVWIEIWVMVIATIVLFVTPLAGVWIEI